MNFTYKDLSVSSLNIYEHNPRFERAPNQREAIKRMVEDQQTKLVNLAKDIIKNGLNPADPLFVVRDEISTRKFNVIEGNRRITVLKLLDNLKLIPASEPSVTRGFKKLQKSYLEFPIRKVTVIVFESFEDAQHWIKLKHTGQNDGVGTVGWDYKQQQRFDEGISGKSSVSLQVLDFINQSDAVDANMKDRLKDVPSTSLGRLISDPAWREIVGIELRKGVVLTDYDPDEIIKPLIRTITDLLKKDFKVGHIYSKEDRAKYLETFKKEDLPDKSKRLAQDWALTSTDPPKRGSAKGTGEAGPSTSGGSSKQRPKKKRVNVIPRSTIFSIKNPRVETIYLELKKLKIKDYPNSTAVLLRVFMELSLDSYLDKSPIANFNHRGQKATLAKKVLAVSQYFLDNGIMTRNELKAANVAGSSAHSILSINTFNAYVHNNKFHPEPDSLRLSWDNLEGFFVKLWELI